MGLYNINGKEYHLKEKFTLRDWQDVLTIDEMFKKISQTENGKPKAAYEAEEIVELLKLVLLDKDNNKPTEEELLSVPIEVINLVLPDFFLEYMKRQINSMSQFQNLVEKATNVLKQ